MKTRQEIDNLLLKVYDAFRKNGINNRSVTSSNVDFKDSEEQRIYCYNKIFEEEKNVELLEILLKLTNNKKIIMCTASDYKAWLTTLEVCNVVGKFVLRGFPEIQYSSKEEAEKASNLMSNALSF